MTDLYFSHSGHEERQKYFKALRNRQDLFQEEGILSLILDAIDKVWFFFFKKLRPFCR
jgi:hypothetical protein